MVILIVIGYLIGTTLIIGWIQRRMNRGKTGESFLFADRSLGSWVGGATIALCAIGSVHTTGLMEAGAIEGFTGAWITLGAAISIVMAGCWYAPLYRKMKINTIPEAYHKMFDNRTRLMCSVINIVVMMTFLSLETQAGGIMFNALLGIDMTIAIPLFFVCAVLYMISSGMWQVAWLNMLNALVSYAVFALVLYYITKNIPGGWSGVEDYYISTDQVNKMILWPQGWQAWLAAPIPLFIGAFMQNPLDQGMAAYFIAAKDTRTARRMGFTGALFNGPYGAFTLVFGIVAMAIPAYAAVGTKTAGLTMLLDVTPTFVKGMLLATFIVMVLSTFARMSMGVAQIIINDFYIPYSKDENKLKKVPTLSRVLIIVAGLIAMIPAFAMPQFLLQVMYCFALSAVMWVPFVLGVFWKRNAIASFWSMLAGLIVSTAYEYFLHAALAIPSWIATMYIGVIVTGVVYIVICQTVPNQSKIGISLALKNKEVEFEATAI
jgi:SSS family solute:Na+ symporter